MGLVTVLLKCPLIRISDQCPQGEPAFTPVALSLQYIDLLPTIRSRAFSHRELQRLERLSGRRGLYMEDRPEVMHNEVQVVLTLAVTTLDCD